VALSQLGDLVVDNRPLVGGYATWGHLATVLRNKGDLKNEVIDRLEKYLTVHGWVDTNVVNHVPFGPTSARLYPVQYERGEPAVYRRGPGKDFRNMIRSGSNELGWIDGPGEDPAVSGTTAAVYAHDELFPGYVEVVHRAPVNINSACEEVLVALLADLRGVFLMEKRSGGPVDLGPGDISYTTTNWLVGTTSRSRRAVHLGVHRTRTAARSALGAVSETRSGRRRPAPRRTCRANRRRAASSIATSWAG
jgi:hypothetical protein